MKSMPASACVLALCVATGTIHAQSSRQGHIELRWGDAPAGNRSPSQPELYIADGHGGRERVDLDAARRATGNLYSLYGQQVDMTLAPGPWPNGHLVPSSISGPGSTSASPMKPFVAGSQPWVTLLCRFPDIAGPDPRPPAFFTELMSNNPGRMDHYWREVSYDQADIAGSEVAGWFTLPYPRSHYVPDDAECSSDVRADLDALWNDCTAVADAQVDFSPFAGINTMYNGDLDGCAWGGAHYAELDGVEKVWYSTWEPPWAFADQAPLAHEMGHGFGLPHANNSDKDDNPYDNPWDLMSDAWDNSVLDQDFGLQPKHISIWSRDRLGWISAPRKLVISDDGTTNGIVLDRASLRGSTNVQMIVVTLPPTASIHRYYVIEARKRVGGYESALAGDAVIIHEVDATRNQPAWSVDADVPPADYSFNEGSMFKVGESWTEPTDAFTVTVVSATAEGFVLNVQRGSDVIFQNDFD